MHHAGSVAVMPHEVRLAVPGPAQLGQRAVKWDEIMDVIATDQDAIAADLERRIHRLQPGTIPHRTAPCSGTVGEACVERHRRWRGQGRYKKDEQAGVHPVSFASLQMERRASLSAFGRQVTGWNIPRWAGQNSRSVSPASAAAFSRLGLSTGGTEASAIAIIHAALDHGVNLLDTAAPYGTEDVVGKAIKSVTRDSVVIATKSSVIAAVTLDAGRVVASLDNSLRELGIDCIDVFQLHAVPPSGYDYVRDVIAPVLLKEKERGNSGFLGITETSPNDLEHQMLRRAIPDGIWDVAMVAFHLMNQNTREAVFPATSEASRRHAADVRRARHLRRDAKRVVEAMKELAAAVQRCRSRWPTIPIHSASWCIPGGATSLTDAAYRYVRHEPGVDVVLFGTGDQAHLRANIESILRPPLPQADRDKLKEFVQPSAWRGPGCTIGCAMNRGTVHEDRSHR